MNQIISLSGGKDSTAMLLLMLERGEPIHSVVWFDTGWEFPVMAQHIRQVEEYTGIEIVRLKPEKSFDYWMFERPIKSKEYRKEIIGILPGPEREEYEEEIEFEEALERWELDPYEYKITEIGEIHRIGNGWPSPMRRWCTRLKCDAIDKYIKTIEDPVSCIGFAVDEWHRTGSRSNQKRKLRFPLIEWGITEKQALEHCYLRGFTWNGLYEHFHRVSCFCCPLQNFKELRTLRREFPELWAKMLEMDSKIPGHNKGFKDYDTVHDLERRFKAEDRQLRLYECVEA